MSNEKICVAFMRQLHDTAEIRKNGKQVGSKMPNGGTKMRQTVEREEVVKHE